MDNQEIHNEMTKVTFTYDDNQRHDEVIAIKTLIFSILRNLPHDVAINTIRTIENNKDNPAINNLCVEMVDAIIATTKIVDKN